MEPVLAQVNAPSMSEMTNEAPPKMRKAFEGADIEPMTNEAQMRETLEKKLKERAEISQTNKFDQLLSRSVKPEDPNLRVIQEPFTHVLLNIGNVSNRPRAPKPLFRILGFFTSADEAREQVREWLQSHPWLQNDCPIHCLPASTWLVLCKTWEQQRDSQFIWNTVDTVLTSYYNELEKHRLEFETNVKERKTGEASEAFKEKQRQEKKDKRPKHRRMNQEQARQMVLEKVEQQKLQKEIQGGTGAVRARTWPNDIEVRGQKVAGISYVVDRESKEVLLRIYAGFENDEKFEEWKNGKAAQRIKHFHLDSVDMYEWKSPTDVDPTKVAEKFRNEALDKIMNQPKKETRKLEEFDEWCHDEDAPNPNSVIKSSGEVVRNEAAKKQAIDVRHEEGNFKIVKGAQGDTVEDVSTFGDAKQEASQNPFGDNWSAKMKKPDIDMTSRAPREPTLTLDENNLGNSAQGRRARRAERLGLAKQ